MTTSFLGIDVGYSQRRRSTGLCLLTLDDRDIRWRCLNTGTPKQKRLEALRCLVPADTDLLGVGIDGPLSSKLGTVDHYRSADALLSRGPFQGRGKPGQTHVPVGQELHHHATELAKLVIELQDQSYLSVASASHLEPVAQGPHRGGLPHSILGVPLGGQRFPQPPACP